MRLAVIFAATMSLAGCAVAPSSRIIDGKVFQPQANISGTLFTGAMRRQPPLAERGITKIGVVAKGSSEVDLTNVALTIFGNKNRDIDFSACLAEDRLSRLLVERIQLEPGYSAVDLSSERDRFLEMTEWRTWPGDRAFKNRNPAAADYRRSLMEEYDIEAILYVDEDITPDFVGGTAVQLGPKGLYTRKLSKNFAYASFDVRLIDLSTGKQPSASAYHQASYWQMDQIDWDESWDRLPEDVRQELCRKLQVLDLNNAMQAVWMFRIDEGEEPDVPGPLRQTGTSG